MSYDLYVALGGSSKDDVDAVVEGNYQDVKLDDIATRIRLLAGVAARNEGVKDYTVSGDRRQGGGYKSLVHAEIPKQTAYAKDLVTKENARLDSFGLLAPNADGLLTLPHGSWFLQFTFTLAKSWISRDDDPFYVAESVNPVRKDKVFKLPVMSAASWKGLLRWTAMQTRLVNKKDSLDDEAFAQERLALALLFGDEKGEEPGQSKDFARFLNDLRQTAAELYLQKVRDRFSFKTEDETNTQEKTALPHHAGRLFCYPSFFNLIDVEVINPHSRKTKAGTHPIYLECVPSSAQGTFSLLYVPFDLIGQDDEVSIRKQARLDLLSVAEAVHAMMLTYGFSAKRTSGYGMAKDRVENGRLMLREAGFEELTAAPPSPATTQPLPRYLAVPGQLKPEYLNSDGTFRERTQAELSAMKKADKQEYEKAKKWWEREGQHQTQPGEPEAEPSNPTEAPKPRWVTYNFKSLLELVERAREIAAP